MVNEMDKKQVKIEIDGIKAKFIFLDDFSQPTSENTKINTKAINEWLDKEGQKTFEVIGITFYAEPIKDGEIEGLRPIRKENGNG